MEIKEIVESLEKLSASGDIAKLGTMSNAEFSANIKKINEITDEFEKLDAKSCKELVDYKYKEEVDGEIVEKTTQVTKGELAYYAATENNLYALKEHGMTEDFFGSDKQTYLGNQFAGAQNLGFQQLGRDKASNKLVTARFFGDYSLAGDVGSVTLQNHILCEMLRDLGGNKLVNKFLKDFDKLNDGQKSEFQKIAIGLDKDTRKIAIGNDKVLPIDDPKFFEMFNRVINEETQKLYSGKTKTKGQLKESIDKDRAARQAGTQGLVDKYLESAKKGNVQELQAAGILDKTGAKFTPEYEKEIISSINSLSASTVSGHIAARLDESASKMENEKAKAAYARIAEGMHVVANPKQNEALCALQRVNCDLGITAEKAKEMGIIANCKSAGEEQAKNFEKAHKEVVKAEEKVITRAAGEAPNRAAGPFYKRCQGVIAMMFASRPTEGLTKSFIAVRKEKGLAKVSEVSKLQEQEEKLNEEGGIEQEEESVIDEQAGELNQAEVKKQRDKRSNTHVSERELAEAKKKFEKEQKEAAEKKRKEDEAELEKGNGI